MGQAVCELYEADASLRLDLSKRLFRVLAVVTVGTTDGSVSVPDINQGTMIVLLPQADDKFQPSFSKSGTTVSWTYDPSVPTASRAGGTAKIGVW